MASRLLRVAGFGLGLLIALVVFLPETVAQVNYPVRPIRIIAPVSPGSGSDILARLMAQALSERVGRPVVVDNRPGAGTTIGNEAVAKAPADGYTLLMGVSTLSINPVTYTSLPYDAMRDFAPITLAVTAPNVIVVHPSVPAKSVKEFIALARARPGEIQFASAGYGTNPHLAMEMFASMAHIRMVHIPYKGDAPSIVDLIGGHVAITASPLPRGLPHVRAGRLRALGVTSASRVAQAPDIPTIAEAGLPGYEAVQWYGMLAPARTPLEIIARLHKELVAILRAPKNSQRLAGDGMDVVASSPEEFAIFIKTETVKWAKVAKDVGLKPE